jgi:radical SAM-linked protein
LPAEALARQARLSTALSAVELAGPSREPACLQELRAMGSHAASPAPSLLEAILSEDLAEEAHEMLRWRRRDAADRKPIEALAASLAPFVEKAHQRRAAFWQLDTRRALIRLTYAKKDEAVGFDDGDLHALFLRAFQVEGLRLALDLGKRPRPMLSAGLPLSAGVAGWAESMDAVLKLEPADDAASLMARLNRRLPSGLHLHRWDPLPLYASPVSELAALSWWRWEVPSDQRAGVQARVSAFLEAEQWRWERGSKQEAVDLRAIVAEMHWEADALVFATRMGVFQAINPLKMLGAILEREALSITGLVRTSVDLRPDARLGQAERFEPKLKNMYEDAVLLGGGSNITLVDDDDDEPIVLG